MFLKLYHWKLARIMNLQQTFGRFLQNENTKFLSTVWASLQKTFGVSLIGSSRLQHTCNSVLIACSWKYGWDAIVWEWVILGAKVASTGMFLRRPLAELLGLLMATRLFLKDLSGFINATAPKTDERILVLHLWPILYALSAYCGWR